MWITKKITLFDGAPPHGTLLRAETLQQHQQVLSLLDDAQQQADRLLDEAQQQSAQLLAEAQQQANDLMQQQQQQQDQQFWQQANVMFEEWQQQRQREESLLVDLAERLLTQAMDKLLASFQPEQRIEALLRQLLQELPPGDNAQLYCSSAQHEQVTHWLAQQPYISWEVRVNETLGQDRLLLVGQQGELEIGWDNIVQQLAPAHAEPPAPE